MPYIIIKKSERERSRMADSSAPAQMRGQVSAVVRNRQDAENLAARLGGRNLRPEAPVMVDTGRSRVMVVGLGQATAAELQDLAVAAIERQETQRGKTGTDVDFDAMRERAGMMRREDVDAAVRNAMADRVARHKRNPFSDPARVSVTESQITKRKATRRTRTT